jgi:hypothetical protein
MTLLQSEKTWYVLALLGLALFVTVLYATPHEAGPTDQGHTVMVDLPPALRSHNIGGSDGVGLCVFTSCQHTAIYQNVEALKTFQKWMSRHPGGGYPEKVDAMIAQMCKEENMPVPLYVQYEGKDPTILEEALASGRMPCVTYDGRDNFYHGHIEHMVNLVYLDKDVACILDNNRPEDNRLCWMTRDEFLSRWVGVGGRDRQAWAVIFLDPAPSPVPYSE